MEFKNKMLLKKLNVLYEQVMLESKKDASIDPAPMDAKPNKSLTDSDEYFTDRDEKRSKKVKPGVPDEFTGKKADFKRSDKRRKKKS